MTQLKLASRFLLLSFSVGILIQGLVWDRVRVNESIWGVKQDIFLTHIKLSIYACDARIRDVWVHSPEYAEQLHQDGRALRGVAGCLYAEVPDLDQ